MSCSTTSDSGSDAATSPSADSASEPAPVSSDGFCAELATTTAQSQGSAEEFEAAEGDPVRQFVVLFAAAGDIHIFLQRLAAAAPSEIRADLEALATASEPNFAGAAANPAATFVAHLATSLSTANAAQRVDDYALQTCGQPVFGEVSLKTAKTEASPRREGDVVVINGTSIHGTARCPGGFYFDQTFKIEQDVAIGVCDKQAFAIDLGAEQLPELWHRELPGEALFWDLRGDSFVASWQETIPPQGLSEELVTETVASFDLRTGEERWSTQLIGPESESAHGVQSVEHIRFGVAYYGLGPNGEVILHLPTGPTTGEGASRAEPTALMVLGGDTGKELWRGPEIRSLVLGQAGVVTGRPELVYHRFDSTQDQSGNENSVVVFDAINGAEVLRQEISGSGVFDGLMGARCSAFVMLGDAPYERGGGGGYWAANTINKEAFVTPLQPEILTPAGLLSLDYRNLDPGDNALIMTDAEGELWRLAPEVFTDWEYVDGLLVVANPNGEVFEVDLATGEVVAPWKSRSPVDDNILPEKVDSGWAIAHTGAVGRMSQWEHSRC